MTNDLHDLELLLRSRVPLITIETRDDVERMLGLPVATNRVDDGHVIDVYVVESRTEPSAARAAGHATADLFSFGLWEFVGGPIEAYRGRRQQVEIRYDDNDRVVSIDTDPQPSR